MQTQATPWILKKWTGFVFRSWSLLFIHHLCFVILHGFFRDLWYFKQEWIMHFVLYWCSNLYIFLCTKIQSESKQNALLEVLITIKRCCFQYLNLHALKLKIIPNYRLRNCWIMNLVGDFSPLFDLSDFIMNSQLILLTGRAHSVQQFERFWPCMYGPLGSH